MKEPSQPTMPVTRPALGVARAAALACALAALLPAVTAAAPDPLVARVVEAYGGRAALSKAKALRQRGRIASKAREGREGALLRVFALPDSLRVEIAYSDGTGEVRVAHQGRATREGADVTGAPPGNAMVLQAARIALPLWLASDPARARRLDPVEREGKRLERLSVSVGGELELVAEVDGASGRILRTVGKLTGPGGAPFEFVNEYSDFRKVDGVLFPMRELNFAGGQQTGETRLERVEVLAEAPPGAFAPSSERL
jgi:hypothetical protein